MTYPNMLLLEMLDNTRGVCYKITDCHDRQNDIVIAMVSYEGGLYQVVIKPISSEIKYSDFERETSC